MGTPEFSSGPVEFLEMLQQKTSIMDRLNKEKLLNLFKNVRIERRSAALELSELFGGSLMNDERIKKFKEIGGKLSASTARYTLGFR